MKKLISKIFLFIIVFNAFLFPTLSVYAETENTDITLTSPSAILMEVSTGQILYTKNENEILPPASVTKIMTLLLVFDSIKAGKFGLDDIVTVSQHAASMGGSQVYLETGEQQTVDTLIKCIAVSSGNDAAVAMAEHVSGNEEAFVKLMNERAKGLGMDNTTFFNCCGLEANGTNTTTAHDIALMSRELLLKHPEVYEYTTIWMDSFTHVTRKGETEFGLANTNKLLKSYNGATGLKTGFTQLAKYCISATANRNGIDLIAVIMSAPDIKTRTSDASKLLDYGFANCTLYTDDKVVESVPEISIKKAQEKTVAFEVPEAFNYVCTKSQNPEEIIREIKVDENLQAPIKKGDILGKVQYFLNEAPIGELSILAKEDIEKMSYPNTFGELLLKFLSKIS